LVWGRGPHALLKKLLQNWTHGPLRRKHVDSRPTDAAQVVTTAVFVLVTVADEPADYGRGESDVQIWPQ